MLADSAMLRVGYLKVVYQDSRGISNTDARICHVLVVDLLEHKIKDVQK